MLLKTEGAAPPPFKLQFVSQQLVCEYHHWSCVISPHKSLLVKPIMAQKRTFKKLPMVTELAVLFVEDWHLFAKTKAKVFETGGQEGNLYEEKASLLGQYWNVQTQKILSQNLHPCTQSLYLSCPIIDFLMCGLLWVWIILLVEMTLEIQRSNIKHLLCLCFSIFSLWTECPITNATTDEPKDLY